MKHRIIFYLTVIIAGTCLWVPLRWCGIPAPIVALMTLPWIAVLAWTWPERSEGRHHLGWAEFRDAWRQFRKERQ